MLHLAFWDYVAIAVYFAVTAAIGFSVTRRKTDTEDLFLAGRTLGPVAIGFSLFASNISSDTLVGLPGAAYSSGISVANYEWMAGVILILAIFLVLPVLSRTRVQTMPELMERRFDGRMRSYLSVITLVLSILLDTAGTLFAGALVLTTFMPQLTIVEVCYGLALFAGLYSAAGGLRAVVYTDVVQGVVLLLGSGMLAFIVFGKFDYSWQNVTEALDPDHLSLIRPLDDPGVPWLGLLTGLPIVGFYYWTMNQYVVQRLFGARDMATAGRASLFAAILKLLPMFLMVIPGAMAVPLLTDLEHPDQVFPTMVAEFAPVGLAGLIFAGLMAALMSTCSSTLNSAATLLTLDFIKPRKPEWSGEKLAWTGRVLTLVVTLIAATWAPMIQYFEGIWAYLQQIFAFVASPLVAVFLYGLFSKRLGASAALRGLASGHLASALLAVAYFSEWIPIHFTVIGGVVFAATLVLTFVWKVALGESDAPAGDDARIADFARHGLEKMPRDVWCGAFVVLAVVAATIYAFR
ncbi:sodium:solute symporter family transporter [Pseudomonas matsuisoli]|uniref:Sodium/glucose cotransporter 2 n=1 Tax=Pseudomonas matsuisoli TaxID=1515666 RepID=A0A917PY30_9PSED|nr:sodium/solute symporter [Pseudomonas matsuisoli]GGJ98826.1 sodium/glucose cotransporter 2 [Pseudomonas matsuisoli]